MADSIGGPVFPRTGIQEGHLHFDKTSNTLHIYNGGDPADTNNWSEVTIGGGGGGVSTVVQRWSFKATGTEWGASISQDVEEDYFIPAGGGTITGWGISAYVGSFTSDILIQLIRDKFNAFDIIDEITVPATTTQTVYLRIVSRVVAADEMVSIFIPNILNPAELFVKLSGYVEFTSP